MSGWRIYDVNLRREVDAWEVRGERGDLRVIVAFSERELFEILPKKPTRLEAAAHICAGGRGTLEGDWRDGALAAIQRRVLLELDYQTRCRSWEGLEKLEAILPSLCVRGPA